MNAMLDGDGVISKLESSPPLSWKLGAICCEVQVGIEFLVIVSIRFINSIKCFFFIYIER